MTSNESSRVIQSWRERPPSSYSLKVENFPELVNSTLSSDGKYQSRRFSSFNYEWRLIIYPKGNENDNGKGFLSMYVEIDSTSFNATTQTEVYADLRFFVFNKKQNKYFIIQDVESKPFNTLRMMWGLSQVLPLETFNNNINGYLFDGDQCEFGVDIFVSPPPTKLEIVSFDVELPYPKFSWSVKNFSEIKENPHKSKIFSMGGKKWVLELYPKGYSSSDGNWVSIFLLLDSTLKQDEKIYVQADLKVEDPRGCIHKTYKVDYWFAIQDDCYGWDHFMSIADLRKSYLDKEDTLKVEIEFEIISVTSYSS